jgi:hypothetical protein
MRWRWAALLLGAVALCWGAWYAVRQPAPPRILLYGVDGMDWGALRRFWAEGGCPTFHALALRGATAALHTPYGASPMVWTSIATGRRVERHGVRGFGTPSQQRKVKALWNLLTDAGLPSVWIGWWATAPAEPIRGVMISNQAIPQDGTHLRVVSDPAIARARQVIAPAARSADLMGRIAAAGAHYATRPGHGTVDFRYRWDGAFASVAKYLVATERWQVFSLYVRMVDVISHLYNNGLYKFDPAAKVMRRVPGTDEAKSWAMVREAYTTADADLAALLELIPDRDHLIVVVVSDHGFHWDGWAHSTQPVPDGVLIINGPGIAPAEISDASIFDVLPTLLALERLPLSRELPGHILPGIVPPHVEPPYVDRYDAPRPLPPTPLALQPEFVEELRQLGYIK